MNRGRYGALRSQKLPTFSFFSVSSPESGPPSEVLSIRYTDNACQSGGFPCTGDLGLGWVEAQTCSGSAPILCLLFIRGFSCSLQQDFSPLVFSSSLISVLQFHTNPFALASSRPSSTTAFLFRSLKAEDLFPAWNLCVDSPASGWNISLGTGGLSDVCG